MQAADRHDLLPGRKRSMTGVKTLALFRLFPSASLLVAHLGLNPVRVRVRVRARVRVRVRVRGLG